MKFLANRTEKTPVTTTKKAVKLEKESDSSGIIGGVTVSTLVIVSVIIGIAIYKHCKSTWVSGKRFSPLRGQFAVGLITCIVYCGAAYFRQSHTVQLWLTSVILSRRKIYFLERITFVNVENPMDGIIEGWYNYFETGYFCVILVIKLTDRISVLLIIF